MKRYYTLDDTNHILTTCDEPFASPEMEAYGFPDGFDFADQRFYQIIDGELLEDTEKREQEEESRMEQRKEAERMEAQVLYTAMMTDTLLEE